MSCCNAHTTCALECFLHIPRLLLGALFGIPSRQPKTCACGDLVSVSVHPNAQREHLQSANRAYGVFCSLKGIEGNVFFHARFEHVAPPPLTRDAECLCLTRNPTLQVFEFAWQYPILLTLFTIISTYSFFVPWLSGVCLLPPHTVCPRCCSHLCPWARGPRSCLGPPTQPQPHPPPLVPRVRLHLLRRQVQNPEPPPQDQSVQQRGFHGMG